MDTSHSWLAQYNQERGKILEQTPLAYEKKYLKGEPTWWDRLRARLTVGSYNSYMKPTSMGISKEVGFASYIEEAALCYAILGLMKNSDNWKVGEHCLTHIPSSLVLWVANKQPFLHVYSPQKINLRRGSQALLWNGYEKIKLAQQRGVDSTIRSFIAGLEHS